jgi:S1-C subfamily serine protease
MTEEGEIVTGVGAPPLLSAQGKGQLAEYPFIGTGFYVGNGYVLTNRHIAQPWTSTEGAQSPGNPRLKSLRAYFPGRREALTLQVKSTAKDDDLAVCTVGNRLSEIPVLPLETNTTPATVGSEVMVMGYPSGPDRILSALKAKEAENLQRRYGNSLDNLLNRLAELNAIRPLNTFGNITDSYKDRVIYDADTSEGGSGGPILNSLGRVIGISFGVFTGNNASNFGVPVANALSLLQKAGWQPIVPQSSPSASPTP